MKKLFFTILLLILFFGLLPIAKADQQLLIDYPEIGGMKLGEGTTLPEIIKYIYLFSLGIVGLTAFVCIIIGAVNYITSAGNDTKMSDAKNRITSALLGILILLASVLILRTINPDLVNIGFVLPEIKGGGGGGINNYCECTLKQRFMSAAPDQSNPATSCQQYVKDNCPQNANSCNLSNTLKNLFNDEWTCDWEAIWGDKFGPLACKDCDINAHPCSSYFNNSLHIPCASPGVTCSVKCL